MKKVTHNRITVSYERVSTSNQVENGAGLKIQREKISEYCKEKGIALGRTYEDRGISGTVKDRPGLLQLLKDCETGIIGRVVVYKQDRLSRELTVSLWLETQFKKHDIEICSVVDPDYDLEDPLQKAFKRIADVFAELEKDVIAARLRDGRVNNAKNGERGSGPIPFGYKKVDGKLVTNPEEAQYVERIFRWALRGFRYSKIVDELNKRHVLTKRGKPFQIPSVRYVLSNKMYFGQTTFGNINSVGIHAPIISKRLFRKAQRQMGILL